MEGDVYPYVVCKVSRVISIHSLRMEGDIFDSASEKFSGIISIHSLRMEGDVLADYVGFVGNISIHSLRMEGDASWNAKSCAIEHFNPLPPHGGRRRVGLQAFQKLVISIHSLRMEGDLSGTRRKSSGSAFQSTPSAWRETG